MAFLQQIFLYFSDRIKSLLPITIFVILFYFVATFLLTQYSYNVVNYGLKDASSKEEIIEIIKKWQTDKWGAQIGGIQTICQIAPWRFDYLIEESDKLMVCRIAK